jgi:hypothetical protein
MGLMIESGTSTQRYMLQTGRTGVSNAYFNLRDVSNGRDIWSVLDTNGTFQGHTPFEWNNAAVFNNGGLDYDFRVESDNNEYALFVDASENKTTFNTSYTADGGVVTIRGTYGAHNASDYRGNNALALTGADPGTTSSGAGINLAFVPVSNRGATAVISGENTGTNKEGGAQLRFSVGGSSFPTTQKDMLMLNYDNGAIFNEGSADLDFRVESNNNSSMFVVDAGADFVDIGGAGNIGGQLNIIGSEGIRGKKDATYKTATMMQPTAWGYSVGTYAVTQLGDQSTQGTVSIGYDPSGNTDGSFSGTGIEMLFAGDIHFYQPNSADTAWKRQLRMINTAGVIINDNSDADLDFRVESNNSAYAVYVDAAQDSVGILTNATDAALNVNSQSGTKDAIRIVGSGGNNFIAGYGNQGNLSFTISEVGADDPAVLTLYRNGIASHILDTDENSETVFNEQGDDIDFRVESTNRQHMLFVDAGNDAVGIGAAPLANSELTIYADDPVLTLRDSKAGSSWVAGDGLGQLEYFTSDGTGIADHAVARIKAVNGGTNSAAPDAVLIFETAGYNVQPAERMRIGNSDTTAGVTINETGVNQDFRVESNNISHMLFVEAAADCVSIGSGSDKGAILNIDGNVRRGGYMTLSNFNSNNDVIAFNYNIPENSANVTPIYSGVAAAGGSFIHMESGGGGTLDFRAAMHGTDTAAFAYTDAGKYLTMRPTAKAQGELVVNQDSNANIDFRVESDSNTHMLFVDAGNNRLGIGSSSPNKNVEILAANPTLRFEDTASGSKRLDIGVLDTAVAFIDAPQSAQTLKMSVSGTESITQYHNTNGVVFNEDSADRDFRVESDSNSNALVVDAGSNYVSVGQNSVTNPGNGNNNSGWSATTAGRMWASTAADHGFNRTSDGVVLSLRSGGVERGKISISGSTTTYATTSDVRAKENIVDAPSASDDIDAIQVRSFDWKADGLHQKYGMVAQELLTVAPDAVAQGDTEEDMMGVDYSKLVPMLIKEIQTLRARVAQLESN